MLTLGEADKKLYGNYYFCCFSVNKNVKIKRKKQTNKKTWRKYSKTEKVIVDFLLKIFQWLPQHLRVKPKLISMGSKILYGKMCSPNLLPWFWCHWLFTLYKTQQPTSFLLLDLELCDPFMVRSLPLALHMAAAFLFLTSQLWYHLLALHLHHHFLLPPTL